MKVSLTSLNEIKMRVLNGEDVYWGNTSYKVMYNIDEVFLIVCTNGHYFNLETNGVFEYKLEDFYHF